MIIYKKRKYKSIIDMILVIKLLVNSLILYNYLNKHNYNFDHLPILSVYTFQIIIFLLKEKKYFKK